MAEMNSAYPDGFLPGDIPDEDGVRDPHTPWIKFDQLGPVAIRCGAPGLGSSHASFDSLLDWAEHARPTREITDPAELDALPVGSIVMDSDGDAWQRTPERWRCPLAGAPSLPTGGLLANFGFVTLLHTPTEETNTNA